MSDVACARNSKYATFRSCFRYPLCIVRVASFVSQTLCHTPLSPISRRSHRPPGSPKPPVRAVLHAAQLTRSPQNTRRTHSVQVSPDGRGASPSAAEACQCGPASPPFLRHPHSTRAPHRHPWRRHPSSTRHSHQLLTWPHLDHPHPTPSSHLRACRWAVCRCTISREAQRSPGRRRRQRPSRKPWARSGTCLGRRRRSPWQRRWRRICSRCQA